MKLLNKFLLLTFILIFFNSCNNNEVTDVLNEYPIPKFLTNLSELKLFEGELSNLQPASNVEILRLNTPLFTDYSEKLRFISIPKNQFITYIDEGLPNFPDNTIISKTFFYYNDARDFSLGKKIIETRILIKQNGIWNMGNYLWNDEQTEAVLTNQTHTVDVNWIDDLGNSKTVNYVVPDFMACINCHQVEGTRVPIGPKIRNLNHNYKGVNQLDYFMDRGILTGITDVSNIVKLPNWEVGSYTLEERGRAYLDVNCAHCHQPGGMYNMNFGNTFDLRYETLFEDSNIQYIGGSIVFRMKSYQPGYSMPLIGTTMVHDEGFELIEDYINSL